MEGLFEFLFKYRPVVFEQGALAFAPTGPTVLAAVVAIAAIGGAIVAYLRVRARDGRLVARDRAILATLRAAAIALVLVCLFRPMVVLSAAVPQRNVVGILIDDSRSMRIADESGKPRADAVKHLVGGADSALVAELSKRFVVRTFRTGGGGERVSDPRALAYDGGRTRLGDALVGAAGELAGAPLSGIVMLTDGADNSLATLDEPLAAMRARGVPVYTVGVGQSNVSPDVEVAAMDAPRAVLQGTSLVAAVTLVQRGYAGRVVKLSVEDGGHVVATRDVTLAKDGAPTVVRVRVPTTEPGPRVFTARVASQDKELIAANNARDVRVTVRDRRARILYVEGEPRFEMKFLRRAVADDSTLNVVGLLRSADEKYLRLGVQDSLELAAGFPRTREELFHYDAIILGSIEASAFTADQLRMLADFVSERGGGLLALGGRRTLAEGAYAGTPLADALPVELPDVKGTQVVATELTPEPTTAGLVHVATQIASSEDSSALRWKTMPSVTTVNRLGKLKPGAVALIAGKPTTTSSSEPAVPLLAWQRYGRGQAVLLAIQDSWLWQMNAPVADLTHEFFWRQLLRWIVSDVPGRVELATLTDDVAPGDPIEVRAEVNDARWVRSNGADAVARVTSPTGVVTNVPLAWSPAHEGEYRATIVPRERGVHRVEVVARLGADTLNAEPTFVHARESSAEWFDAGQHRDLLRRIARETGGRYYPVSDAMSVAKDIVYSPRGSVVLERMDLWDMPAVFVLLVALLGTEWAYRRRRGLA